MTDWPPPPERSPFQQEANRRLLEILATASESERAFLEAQLAAFIQSHARGETPREEPPV